MPLWPSLAANYSVKGAALKEKIGPAIGRLASGVYIVTVSVDGNADGMLATWITQAGFEPPSLVVSVNKQRDILQSMKLGDKFTINVLSNRNMDIFKAFAKPNNSAKFDGLAIKEGTGAGPVFAEAVSYIDLLVKSINEAGDHQLIVGEVIDGELLNGQDEPMTHLRKDGFKY
jgi:flavin reductase (DIM6/NTAB) family NADH-FMN oxidoreductase RutF